MSASVSQYVLKVYGQCDLSCDHCYVYENLDQSWRHKPRSIAGATVAQAAARITEHAGLHQLKQVAVVLHGGEPLLLGYDRMRDVLRTLRTVIDPVMRLRLTIHSNGVRLDERFCDLFAAYDVRVGISLDGDRTANDRHRRFAGGRSSYDKVLQALALLRKAEYRHLFAGILCTVDVANDPIAVYEALLAQDPPRLDLLLPHATWDHPPHLPPGEHAPYAAWLRQIHDRWVADGRPVPIRLFDSLVAAWQGRRSGSEAAGLDPVDLLVIETDGSWEQADSLKIAYDGAPATGFDVFSHSVDEAAAHPGMAGRRAGISGLCPLCRACPLVQACGGGLYAHRYKTGSGFENPSVYCEDLKILIPAVTDAAKPTRRAREGHEPGGRDLLLDESFDLLAAGPGDRAAMEALADTRYSVNRALVAAVAASLSTSGDLGQAAVEGWRLLSALDAGHATAVREILTYPYVGAWAVRCLTGATDAEADMRRAHLAGLAAAVALRAGIDTELALPVRAGSVYLPAVGAFAVDAGTNPIARVHVSGSGITCPQSTGQWLAVRRVDAAGMSVTVDDIDPFRDCQAWAAAARLPTATWESWRRALTTAAAQLTAELPVYGSVIGAGLRSVVPIRPLASGLRQSATARQAFGAVAVALPEDPGSLCELLLHEMQHLKLTALGDLFDLFDRTDDRRFWVPWRGDTRPVEGLLHGTYAYVAVAELWRSRAMAAPDAQALGRYRVYRSWVEDAIDTLLRAGSLRPAGERFVVGMRATVRGWADD